MQVICLLLFINSSIIYDIKILYFCRSVLSKLFDGSEIAKIYAVIGIIQSIVAMTTHRYNEFDHILKVKQLSNLKKTNFD